MCSRRTGIGADGILWVASDAEGGVRLVILNADGSRPEMCGNGVRCVVAHARLHSRLGEGGALTVHTDAGDRVARLIGTEAAGRVRVEVDMGVVQIVAPDLVLDTPQGPLGSIAVDVGNPHAVLLIDREPDLDACVRAATARREIWPHGVNVEFVRARRAEQPTFDVRVHERGVGWTQACGTGACAVAAAAVLRGWAGARDGEMVRVVLEGGALDVRITRRAGETHAQMSGPARHVFSGTFDDAIVGSGP